MALILILLIAVGVQAQVKEFDSQKFNFKTDQDADVEFNFMGTGTQGKMFWRGGTGENYFAFPNAVKLDGGFQAAGDIGFDGAVIINDSGADKDFRVEGVGAANALVVQGSDGNVGIGTSSPQGTLHIDADDAEALIGFVEA